MCILEIEHIDGWPNIVCLWLCVRVCNNRKRSMIAVKNRSVQWIDDVHVRAFNVPPHTHTPTMISFTRECWFFFRWETKNLKSTKRNKTRAKKINKLNSLKKYLFFFEKNSTRFCWNSASSRKTQRARERAQIKNQIRTYLIFGDVVHF